MTIYYVDPLNGSSANDGLSSGTALGSYFDFFNGAGVSLGSAGGLTNGDIVYLMASTADNYPYTNFGNQFVTGNDWGVTGSIVQVRAVNPTTLEEDGSKYIVTGNDNQYIARFYGNHNGFLYHNCIMIGKWWNYSSGGRTVYVNCVFTDSYDGISHTTASIPMYADNCGNVYRNCKAYYTGSSPYYTAFSQRDGSVYATFAVFDTCEFKDFPVALSLLRNASIWNCRFINCDVAASIEYRTSNRGHSQLINNIVYNTTSNAWDIDEVNTSLPNEPKVSDVMGNLYDNIGGYIYNYTETTATELDTITYDRSSVRQQWEGNVYQNVTTGVHSLPFGTTGGHINWWNRSGDTAANFGLTFDTDGFSPTVATGDDILFNHFVGTPAGLGIFLNSFTTEVGKPEFGDVF